MMTPYEEARGAHEADVARGYGTTRSFEEDVALHLKHAYVFSTPTAFIMGRPVDVLDQLTDILDPTLKYPDPNGWLIYLAAGDIKEFFKYCPFELPYVGWERGGQFVHYPFTTVKRKAYANEIAINRMCGQVPQGPVTECTSAA